MYKNVEASWDMLKHCWPSKGGDLWGLSSIENSLQTGSLVCLSTRGSFACFSFVRTSLYKYPVLLAVRFFFKVYLCCCRTERMLLRHSFSCTIKSLIFYHSLYYRADVDWNGQTGHYLNTIFGKINILSNEICAVSVFCYFLENWVGFTLFWDSRKVRFNQEFARQDL